MNTGLLLIDIQNDYFPGGRMELVGMDTAAEKAMSLLSFFRDNQWPTFHIQHISTSDRAKFFLPDTPGAEIHDKVKPLPQDVVVMKHYPNSFRETTLLEELENARVRRVVFCGAMSHMCIDASTRAAADLGFECVVIHDACTTRDLEFSGKMICAQEVHGAFMAALAAAYARVTALREFESSIRS
jgi:nicotinamidase-related amidase